MQDRDENEIVSDDAEPDEYSDDDGDDVDVDDEEVEDDDEDVDDDEEDEEDEEDEDEEEAESQAGSDEHDDDALPSHEVSPNETRTRLRQREVACWRECDRPEMTSVISQQAMACARTSVASL
jgi:hypothetical protein